MTTVDPTLSTQSLVADWAQVWKTTLATNYVAKKRMKTGAIVLALLYIFGCVLHANDFGFVNIIIGTVAMAVTALYAAQPAALAAFALGGAAYAGTDKDVDLGPGLKAGLETLGRLVNAVMMFIGLTFILLGTWPLYVPPGLYAVVPMGVALIVNIMVYERMKSQGWVWKLFGTYIIVLFVVGALGGIPVINAIFGWIDDKQEEVAEKIKGTDSPTPAAAAPVVRTPPVATDPVCKDYDTGYVLGGVECTVVTLTKDVLEYNAPDGFCVWANSANSQKEIATLPNNGNIRKFYSKTGQPVQAGIFLVKEGSVALGTMCG